MQYVQNPDSNTTTTQRLLDYPVVCIPEHVYKHLYSSSRVITNLLDYNQTYNYLSVDDLCLWISINNRLNVSGSRVSSDDLQDILLVQDTLKTDFNYAVKQALNKPFDSYVSNGTLSAEDGYIFKKHAEAIYIVISKGFIQQLQSIRLVREKFVKNYIEKVYSEVDQKRIIELPIFDNYIRSFPLLA